MLQWLVRPARLVTTIGTDVKPQWDRSISLQIPDEEVEWFDQPLLVVAPAHIDGVLFVGRAIQLMCQPYDSANGALRPLWDTYIRKPDEVIL